MAPLFLKMRIILAARGADASLILSNQPDPLSNQASRGRKPLLSLG